MKQSMKMWTSALRTEARAGHEKMPNTAALFTDLVAESLEPWSQDRGIAEFCNGIADIAYTALEDIEAYPTDPHPNVFYFTFPGLQDFLDQHRFHLYPNAEDGAELVGNYYYGGITKRLIFERSFVSGCEDLARDHHVQGLDYRFSFSVAALLLLLSYLAQEPPLLRETLLESPRYGISSIEFSEYGEQGDIRTFIFDPADLQCPDWLLDFSIPRRLHTYIADVALDPETPESVIQFIDYLLWSQFDSQTPERASSSQISPT